MLRYSLGLNGEAVTVEKAVDRVLMDGCLTQDIATPGTTRVSTTAMGDRIVAALESGH